MITLSNMNKTESASTLQRPMFVLYKNQSINFVLSDCNGTRTHNYLVKEPYHLAKLASLAKWLSVRLQTKSLWVRVPLQPLKL